MTSDEFITLFESHVPEKWVHMIRYYSFLSSSAPMRKMLTEVVYPLSQQDKKSAKKSPFETCINMYLTSIHWLVSYAGKNYFFAGMNFGFNLSELMARHDDMARWRWR